MSDQNTVSTARRAEIVQGDRSSVPAMLSGRRTCVLYNGHLSALMDIQSASPDCCAWVALWLMGCKARAKIAPS